MAGKEKKNSGNGLIFKNAEKAKSAIMESQQKEIRDLYEKWADEIGEKAKYYSHKSNASAPVSERYYKELQKQLRQTSHEVSNEIYKKIKSNMYTISDAVIKDNVEWLSSFGFSKEGLNAAFSYVPNDVVQRLVTGQIYESGWSLSSRIWGDNERTLKDIYQVMARGISEQKPIYEIAKDLEAYVRPSARLPWNLRMNDGKKIYKKQVDYNAQRLARTLTQHSYQQSFIAATEKNPFVKEYVWISNGSRVCDLCKQRDGMHFKKGELPMDHPNGMCTMEPVVDNEEMKNQLVDWFNSPDGTYPEIDEFASNFGYTALPKEEKKIDNQREIKVVNGKDITETWTRRNEEFQYEIDDVINAQGFDGLPTIVDEQEFKKHVERSNVIYQRVYSAPTEEILQEYQNQLYSGHFFVDCNGGKYAALGQGMYAAYNEGTEVADDVKRTMEEYKNQREGSFSKVETFTLTPDAKVISVQELNELKKSLLDKRQQIIDEMGFTKEAIDIARKVSYAGENDGCLAARLGYDVIVQETSYDKYAVILNRTKVIFKR